MADRKAKLVRFTTQGQYSSTNMGVFLNLYISMSLGLFITSMSNLVCGTCFRYYMYYGHQRDHQGPRCTTLLELPLFLSKNDITNVFQQAKDKQNNHSVGLVF